MVSDSGGPRSLASEIVALPTAPGSLGFVRTQCSHTCADETIIFAIIGLNIALSQLKTRLACSSCNIQVLPMHFMRPGGANLPLQIQNIPSFLANAVLIYFQNFGRGQFHIGFYFYHESCKHYTDMIWFIVIYLIWNRRSWRGQPLQVFWRIILHHQKHFPNSWAGCWVWGWLSSVARKRSEVTRNTMDFLSRSAFSWSSKLVEKLFQSYINFGVNSDMWNSPVQDGFLVFIWGFFWMPTMQRQHAIMRLHHNISVATSALTGI